jgi:hypothetical protein
MRSADYHFLQAEGTSIAKTIVSQHWQSTLYERDQFYILQGLLLARRLYQYHKCRKRNLGHYLQFLCLHLLTEASQADV